MAKSLAQIQAQIAGLQKEADALKANEMVGVIERIRDAVGNYGLTVEHIFGVKSAKPRAANSAKTTGNQIAVKKPALARAVARAPVAIKYRDGHGNTWTGRGSRPRWLQTAVENGMSLEDFSVKA